VELKSLPRGDAQRSIGKPVAQVERAEQLAGRQTAAGNLQTHHEHVPLARSRLAPFASVAVVLLVGAVKLQQRHIVGGKFVRIARQFVHDRATQELARLLDQLLLRSFRLLCRRFVCEIDFSCLKVFNRLKLHATVVGGLAQFHRDWPELFGWLTKVINDDRLTIKQLFGIHGCDRQTTLRNQLFGSFEHSLV
jgi:hypothetical protein